ncbi:MAG: hypothetical protein EOP50_08890, partial [Sphingobacteriales bacterium]
MVIQQLRAGLLFSVCLLSGGLAAQSVFADNGSTDDIVPLNAAAKKNTPIEVQPLGLFNNSAVVKINGQERILRLGKASPEGVTLLSANARSAEIDINGKRQTLNLNRGVG